MKLRRTVYPIALIVAIPLVLIVFYILNQGKFAFNPEETVQNNQMDGHIFVAYPMTWEGYGKPIIEEVSVPEKVTPYILQTKHITTEEPLALEAIENVKLKSHQFYLVIETDETQNERLNEKKLEIRYKTFGINRKQELLME
jgi:hypothetical protein